MTATFDPSLVDDVSLVRFHIGDTDTSTPYIQDETISALLESEGSVGAAVIACLIHIIALFSVPNFRKDWLSVDSSTARDGFTDLLNMKRQEFGLFGVTVEASISLPYRADNNQNSSVATYADDAVDDGSGDI